MEIQTNDDGILLELRDYFSFQVPGYQFKRQYRDGVWDGSIKLFNAFERKLYIGLLPYLKKFASQFGYELTVDDSLFTKQQMTPKEIQEFVAYVDPQKKGKPIKPRYYQMMALYYLINAKRSVLVSPTASGKSLIIYLFAKWLTEQNKRLILIVPTTNLVEQMASDFIDYSNGEFEPYFHKIYAGKQKNNAEAGIYITTWQSVYELPKMYFDQFEAVIVDEAHGVQAKSLKTILEKSQAEYRSGLTGTMHDPEAHKWVIEGLLGETVDLISMQELMERKWVSKLKVNCILFNHDEETKKAASNLPYHDEIKLLLENDKRTQKILKAVGKVKENSFVLFDKVKYGEHLFKTVSEMYPERNVYIVYGNTDVEDREKIRQALENEVGSIVIASYKVFSTGTSIDNLHHLFFAEPVGKSKFRIYQSIGRSLRLHSEKEFATLWDFVDKLTNNKSKMNHMMRHFVEERIQRYNEQGFDYRIIKVDL